MTRDLQKFFDRCVETPAKAVLGQVIKNDGIKSSMGPFSLLPSYAICYPASVIGALEKICAEYNAAFQPLVRKNQEWQSDYQYCIGLDGSYVNAAVQIDMVGLPEEFLQVAGICTKEELYPVLLKRIFEVENSLAMYQLLENIFSSGPDSSFKKRYRESLDELRRRHNKPIALLAVTDQKYRSMKESEFGKQLHEPLSDEEVLDRSGFDRFFSPEEFRRHLEESMGACQYLLYVRSSDPVEKLKKPEFQVEHPLLANPSLRQVIKAHSLTFNVDDPVMEYFRRINDTKEYMLAMQMAFAVDSQESLYDTAFLAHLQEDLGFVDASCAVPSADCTRYLQAQGLDPGRIRSGKLALRCKPMKGTYGCYGHISGELINGKFRSELRSNLRKRGAYVMQPEMSLPVIVNKTDGQAYTYIDRNFLAFTNGKPKFLGGFRSLMPQNSVEASKRRNHGNGLTVWAEIA